MAVPVLGFSKKTKDQKIQWLAQTHLADDPATVEILKKYWNSDIKLQKLHDDFIENTLSNYYLPFGVAPNFLINNELLTLPMVTEESSVVAAASNAAKFWLDKGGFTATVVSTQKNGQVHFDFYGKDRDLLKFFSVVKPKLIEGIEAIQKNMKKRGGGLIDIQLVNSNAVLKGYYQLHCTFETLDAMGANFINSCLEQIAKTFESEASNYNTFKTENTFPTIVLSILSNFNPECLVKAEVSCTIEQLTSKKIDGAVFAKKFVRAVAIAKAEARRAVTHNKGIMNGVDALILATGNDFRAVEAGAHSYACKNGKYTSLTDAKVENGIFSFWIEIPLALGTVGGLTDLHPLVKFAFSMLQKPDAKKLMEIVAVAGLAQNFAAIRSLVTTGIQKGHMKMHLINILNQLEATKLEKDNALSYFTDNVITHSAVVDYIEKLRSNKISTKYYSNGKLLLTGEYLVLDGAMALAIPTKYGQSLEVNTSDKAGIHWKSYNKEGVIWFEDSFSYSDLISEKKSISTANSIRETLLIILHEALQLNPAFLNISDGWSVITHLNFPRDWGLGSSSTLINNIALWADVNANELLKNSFGGSGYDIAVAQSTSPILYKLQDGLPFVEPVQIHWDFTNQLFFVHLNKKQDSKLGISRYRNVSISIIELSAISAITHSILACETLSVFEKLVEKHEDLISKIIQMPTIKAQIFSDYPKAIKSLGAWGGDFILVIANEEDLDYFRNRGYETIIPFTEMML